MSIIVCDTCGKWIDTDFYPEYIHDDIYLCEDCHIEKESSKEHERILQKSAEENLI